MPTLSSGCSLFCKGKNAGSLVGKSRSSNRVLIAHTYTQTYRQTEREAICFASVGWPLIFTTAFMSLKEEGKKSTASTSLPVLPRLGAEC